MERTFKVNSSLIDGLWSLLGHLMLLALIGLSGGGSDLNKASLNRAPQVMKVTAWRGGYQVKTGVFKTKNASSTKLLKPLNATKTAQLAVKSNSKTKIGAKTTPIFSKPNELNSHLTRYTSKDSSINKNAKSQKSKSNKTKNLEAAAEVTSLLAPAAATVATKPSSALIKASNEGALTVLEGSVIADDLDSSGGVVDPISGFQQAIMQTVAYFWKRPANLAQEDFCIYLVEVASNGSIIEVRLDQSSGNAALERSAKTAITAAEPLPVPEKKELYEHFKQLRLIFRGSGVIGGR